MPRATTRQRPITNPLALAVLALLFERPMHPYEMASLLRERQKDASIKLNYGSLYTVVDQLQRAGYIVPQETNRDGRRPERTTYAITDAGLARMREWMRDLIRKPAKEYPQFEAALSLMGVLPPDEASDLLAERITRLEAHLTGMRDVMEDAAAAGIPRLFMIESEYELAMTEAELAWVRALHEEITTGSLPNLDLWHAFHEEGARYAYDPRTGLTDVRQIKPATADKEAP
jgi:DNA-binding PadR family transcriptional regulator